MIRTKIIIYRCIGRLQFYNPNDSEIQNPFVTRLTTKPDRNTEEADVVFIFPN